MTNSTEAIMVFHVNHDETETLVAYVDTNDWKEAVAKTQHLDTPWWNNEGVHLVGEPVHRSTTVGDILENSRGMRVGVARYGFYHILEIEDD